MSRETVRALILSPARLTRLRYPSGPPVLPDEPYFIVALAVLKVKFCMVLVLGAIMPKPETVLRLCTKCHSKTVHEVREKTVAGMKLVCTDCGHTLVVTSL
jgi:DNA-directed RNA polymerase subunit RPC12/RpoP